MGFDYLSSHGEVEEDQNICVSGSDDSFVVDVERFSHVIQKKARNVSRKGCNDHTLPAGGSTPEKPVVATPASPKLHHQIGLSVPASEHKQYGPRHSPSTWFIDPRRILIFFATLSSLGTILLIYLTLSIGKLNNNDLN